jgi:hypothetical protein
MPIMHRLACLRDDVVFLIFCYQKYKYKTDFTRVNEYGQCSEPTAEMLQENIMSDENTNEIEGNDDTVASATVKQRRGARDKKSQ